MSYAVTCVYMGLALCLALYGLHRASMVRRFGRLQRPQSRGPGDASPDLPRVCVQLPLYDERTVAARLLRAVGELDYPRERFEVQVLDDSTDDTRAVVDREVAALCGRGVEARVLRRSERSGYKAGALAAGLRATDAELVCLFDADFVPPRDFLRSLVGAFSDPAVGMVQARWTHLNREDGWSTRAQAALLDAHLLIEHGVRHGCGLFFNFNGTAGIWRRAAIESAGGWRADTLTEDLDLSYRAQLAGWRFVWAPDITAPAELPPDLAAFRSQQGRWARGSVQVARGVLGRVLRADVRPAVKLEAVAHLAGNAGYPLVLVFALLAPLVPLGLLDPGRFALPLHALLVALGTLGTFSLFRFYAAGQRAAGRPVRARLVDTVLAVVLGIGMSAGLSAAVVGGLRARGGEFVRTPKRGGRGPQGPQDPHNHRGPRGLWNGGYMAAAPRWAGAELVLAGWVTVGAWAAVRTGQWGSLPFFTLFAAGYAWVGVSSFVYAARNARARRGHARDPGEETCAESSIRTLSTR